MTGRSHNFSLLPTSFRITAKYFIETAKRAVIIDKEKNYVTIPERALEFQEGQLQFSIIQLRQPCVYYLDQKPVWEIKL